MLVCMLWIAPSGYVTFDGKTVPDLPLSGTVVNVSNVSQLYMALRNQQAGQTIVLAAGQYSVGSIEFLDLTVNNITVRGATGNPADVVLIGKGFENCIDVEEEMFRVFAQDITFAAMTLSEVRCNCVKFQGGVNNHTIFHNMRFLNVGERMIKAPGTLVAAQCTLRYCHFENTKLPSAIRCGSSGADSIDRDGNYIAGMDIMKGDGWVIHDNMFLNIKGATGMGRAATFLWGQSQNMIVERNTYIGCDRSIAFGNFGGSGTIGCTARNNFIVPGTTNAIEIANSTGPFIFNNTSFSALSTNSGTIWLYNTQNAEIKNNIICNGISSDASTADTAHNISLGRSQRSLAARWFGDEAQADLHIKSDTCAPVDAGTTLSSVTDDWDGTMRTGTYDIGADESPFTHNAIQGYGITETDGLALAGPEPNPFNPVTILRYKVPHTMAGNDLCISVHDMAGRAIRTVHRAAATPGCHAALWDGLDDNGKPIPSGAYVISLRCGTNVKSVMGLFRQ